MKSKLLIFNIIIAISMCSCSRKQALPQTPEKNLSYAPPSWAPYYDKVYLVPYYYLPDIECYYDVLSKEFVYMQSGNWMFSTQLPAFYSWYNFDNPFVIMLDYNVYQPWMHHQLYVSNYPKYYYHTTFRESLENESRPIHGFNENAKSPIFASRASNSSIRRIPISTNKKVDQSHPMQPMKYYGKNIGRPVKVQPQMKKTHKLSKRKH